MKRLLAEWGFRRAWRAARRRGGGRAEEGARPWVVVTSSDHRAAEGELKRFAAWWRTGEQDAPVTVFAPSAALHAIDSLPDSWTLHGYSGEQLTRLGLPGASLTRQAAQTAGQRAVLLAAGEDRVAELLFALLPVAQKAALARDRLDGVATLLVSPEDGRDEEQALQLLLAALPTFLPGPQDS